MTSQQKYRLDLMERAWQTLADSRPGIPFSIFRAGLFGDLILVRRGTELIGDQMLHKICNIIVNEDGSGFIDWSPFPQSYLRPSNRKD